VLPSGEFSFEVEGTGQVLTTEQLSGLLAAGYATSLVADTTPVEAVTGEGPMGPQHIYEAARVAGGTAGARRERMERRIQGRDLMARIGPYMKYAVLLAALILAFLAWQLYPSLPEGWRGTLQEYVLGSKR